MNLKASDPMPGSPLLSQFYTLLHKEFLTEWRQKQALSAIVLYVFGTVLVCHLGFNLRKGGVGDYTWNVLYWIIMLFVTVNGIAGSFNKERPGTLFYYYQAVPARMLLMAKMLYNVLLLWVTGFIALAVYSLVMDNPVLDQALFFVNALAGLSGLACAFTFIAAISSKTKNPATMSAVLGFPVVAPVLLTAIKVSRYAVEGLDRSFAYTYLPVLLAVNLIIVTVSYLLFPYLWRSN